ncbi:hypothetical protein ARMGADRAFT_1093136 [Armillaria gallica]|uniref:Uncharacterized protein n=1 Tax=Armillaria gallica TaxID=47427 RepID=A0A2H3CTI7_ARMGA|nr:hypothetical protein ARMGADRAFT_1093136 [Armillaria gallica]
MPRTPSPVTVPSMWQVYIDSLLHIQDGNETTALPPSTTLPPDSAALVYARTLVYLIIHSPSRTALVNANTHAHETTQSSPLALTLGFRRVASRKYDQPTLSEVSPPSTRFGKQA